MSAKVSAVLAFLAISALCQAQAVVFAVYGTVVEAPAGNTFVMKASDGAKHTLHAGKETAIYGFEGVVAGSKGAFEGIKTGSEVVAHYSKEGAKLTVVSVRKVGSAGLTATEGTVQAIDTHARTVALKTADGSVHTYKLAENATATASEATANGLKAGSKAVVYSTEAAGSRIAHFVRAL